MKKLTDAQKARIKEDFREWSGGYHPGEAGEEHAIYLDDHEGEYGREELDLFLTQWGEEELKKDSEKRKKKDAERAADRKKRIHELAKSCVSMEENGHQVVIRFDDVKLRLDWTPSKTKAKAAWADAVWLLEKMLERGVKEAAE